MLHFGERISFVAALFLGGEDSVAASCNCKWLDEYTAEEYYFRRLQDEELAAISHTSPSSPPEGGRRV